jgi:putative nucleotidyltransferase with HDIG domain
MRAIRFSVQIGFEIEKKTFESIEKNAKNLQYISQERIRDEFDKIIISENPSKGVDLLIESKLMDQFIPEVIETIGVTQNRHHYHGPYNTVYAHMLASLEKCPSEKLEVRLASFFHDIGKPKSKEGEGEMATFHGHEYYGARIVEQFMNRMKYPRKIIEKTVLLVKNHMFYYNVDEVGEAGVRKVVRKVGLENINDLIDVRIADRLGSGVPKAVPYRLRHFKYMVEKVSKDPISVKQLKVNGDIMIAEMNFKPGREIGAILDVLLSEVIENPELNDKEILAKRVEELRKEDLKSLRDLAKKKIKEEQKKEEDETKGKYHVK